jgi:hypothetical protein
MNIDQYRALNAKEDSINIEQPIQVKEEVKEEIAPMLEEDEVVEKIKIGDEELTIDEIKKGYMRQSDYTKKTQELAEKRKETQHAIDVYERVKNDPELAIQKLNALEEKELEIDELKSRIASVELDKELTLLKVKYPDFDDVTVLNEASRLGLNDLEFVYKATRTLPTSQENKIDENALRIQLKKELLEELKTASVPTTIVSTSNGEPIGNTAKQLSARESNIAKAMGLSDAEYLKWK